MLKLLVQLLVNSLGRNEVLVFLGGSLEATVTHLTGCIDELQVDFLQMRLSDSSVHSLSQQQGSLLGSNATTLDHDVIIPDDSVMRESTQWSNVLFSQIMVSGSVVLGPVNLTFAYSVDLLVLFSSVMVSELSSSGNGPSDSRWMPGTDTTDSSETSMSLSGEFFDTESLDDSGEPVTLGGSDDIHQLEVGEDLVDSDLFFQKTFCEVDFVRDVSTVDLDFKDVGFFGSVVQQLGLCVANQSNN